MQLLLFLFLVSLIEGGMAKEGDEVASPSCFAYGAN